MFWFNNSGIEHRVRYLEHRFERLDEEAHDKRLMEKIGEKLAAIDGLTMTRGKSPHHYGVYYIYQGGESIYCSSDRDDICTFLDGMKAAFTN